MEKGLHNLILRHTDGIHESKIASSEYKHFGVKFMHNKETKTINVNFTLDYLITSFEMRRQVRRDDYYQYKSNELCYV